MLSLRQIELVLTDNKRAAVEWDRDDRISALPRDIMYHILELLPVQDTARTSILSRKWRNNWSMLPYLVLDNVFCNKLTTKSQSIFKETVDEILLQHIGDIVKLVLDVSGTLLSSYKDIDRWIRYVTRNGVKELTLNVSDNTIYKLPSYIFNCPTLTHLQLFNCIFKTPDSFLGFQNLVTLHLQEITFVPTSNCCVINAPLLVNLNLTYCHGTACLNIIASQLKFLIVRESQYLKLNCFMNYKNFDALVLELLELEEVVDKLKYDDERSTLEKLLFSSSLLEELHLGSCVLELLSADVVQDGLPFMFNSLWYLSLGVDFYEMGQTSYALQLIKSFPNLSELCIWVCDSSDNAETVLKYLDTPTWLDGSLKELKYVTIYGFMSSKAELLFVKLLFARTPSLVRMCIEQGRVLSSNEERDIIVELMRFPRASPAAELCYSPHSD